MFGVFKKGFKTNHGLIMGDFNYGGRYIRKTELDKLPIDGQFQRLIHKDAETSVKTRFPYDRIYISKSFPESLDDYGVDTYMGGLNRNEVNLYYAVTVYIVIEPIITLFTFNHAVLQACE